MWAWDTFGMFQKEDSAYENLQKEEHEKIRLKEWDYYKFIQTPKVSVPGKLQKLCKYKRILACTAKDQREKAI